MSASPDPNEILPPQGRLLGVDFGTKRVGIALCTPDRTMAGPLEIYERRNERLDARYFRELLEEYRFCGIVVGLPIHVHGGESQKSREAQVYGKWLHEVTGLPVVYWDERYTSAVAEDFLLAADLTRKQRKKRIDKVAAQIILQAFLDAHRPRPTLSDEVEDDDYFDDEPYREE